MPPVVSSHTANIAAAQALYETGRNSRQVAKDLQISPSAAWRLKHQALLDPDLITHSSKTIADKMLLSATAAVDTFLDQAEAGELRKEAPGRLIKMASVALESAGQYAALSGSKDMLANMMSSYGISESHSSSRVTLEQKITVETGPTTTAIQQYGNTGSDVSPQVVDLQGSHTPK